MSCVLGKHCCSKLSPIAICHLLVLLSISVTQLVLGENGSKLQPISTEDLPSVDEHFFLQKIFDKYGTGGVMTFEGLEHLLESLGLGNLVISDHDISAHKIRNGTFHHPDHTHGIQDLSFYVNRTNETNKTNLEEEQTNSLSKASETSFPCAELHIRTTREVPKQGSRHRHGQNKHRKEKRSTLTPCQLREKQLKKKVKRSPSADNSTDEKPLPKCMSPGELLHTFNIPTNTNISPVNFLHICPAIIYELDSHNCACSRGKRLVKICSNLKESNVHHSVDDHHNALAAPEEETGISAKVWIYGSIAVFIVSLCGLLGVAVVPIMQKVFYNHLLQFLVALAIGSLTGDALLHLIPHAFVVHETIGHDNDHAYEKSHDNTGSHGSHTHFAVWKGATALAGIYFFFVIERAMNAFAEFKRRKNVNKNSRHRMEKGIAHSSIVGVKLSSHDSIHPSCDIINVTTEELLDKHSHLSDLDESHLDKQICFEEICMEDANSKCITSKNVNIHLDDHTQVDLDSSLNHHHHHGHSHSHSHNHHHHSFRSHSHSSLEEKDRESGSTTIASIAWMVIMGDGLHNFSDGLAIGAAFAGDITGGISTSIAVFCHELPHELGDFAVLLKAGMSVKQAVIYNCLSSFLCLIGMLIGIAIGNFPSAAQWIFALASGMFLYIALVDMLPELNSVEPKAGENPLLHLAIQNVGMCIGFTIMLLIAIFENDLRFLLN